MRNGEARFLSCMYVLSLTLLVVFAFRGLSDAREASSMESTPTLVILDAGHGGIDSGASGSDGTPESQLNLEITQKTNVLLTFLGEKTLLTRTSASDLSDPDASTIAQRKITDTRNRVALINSHPEALLISIHGNTYSQPQYHGAQVFYGKNPGSQELAEIMKNSIQSALDSGNKREAKAISPDVYLMNHITVPGVLIETGFLSNESELGLLKSPDYQKQLAVVIAVAASNYLLEKVS